MNLDQDKVDSLERRGVRVRVCVCVCVCVCVDSKCFVKSICEVGAID